MRFEKNRLLATILLAVTSPALADVVTLKNGDKITGTIGQISDGKMEFKSPVLGDIKIEMENVQSYTTDEPATIRMKKDAPTVTEPIKSGDATKVETASGQSIPVADVKVINPPKEAWTGSIMGLLTLERGNTDTLDIGIRPQAMLRRDNEYNDDRLSLKGSYNLGTTGTGDDSETTTDNWDALTQYDRFWTEKWYGYATFKVEHDRIASLNYRLSPGVGLGYQWIESPDMNFNTEAGISYVYEDYDPGETNDFIALRLAYHFDKQLAENLKLFHNLEILPAFEDPSDYILTTDVGLRVDMTKNFFTEGKIEFERDSEPAAGAEKNDVRYILGVGWLF